MACILCGRRWHIYKYSPLQMWVWDLLSPHLPWGNEDEGKCYGQKEERGPMHQFTPMGRIFRQILESVLSHMLGRVTLEYLLYKHQNTHSARSSEGSNVRKSHAIWASVHPSRLLVSAAELSVADKGQGYHSSCPRSAERTPKHRQTEWGRSISLWTTTGMWLPTETTICWERRDAIR